MADTRIDTLSQAHVVEAALAAFDTSLNVDGPDELVELIEQAVQDRLAPSQLEALIRAAGADKDDIVRLARGLLAASAQDVEVQRAVTAAGSKQLVITPDHWYAVTALVVVLLIVKPLKSAERKSTTFEESKDGKRKLTVNEETIYLNPLSTVVTLLDKIREAVLGGPSPKG